MGRPVLLRQIRPLLADMYDIAEIGETDRDENVDIDGILKPKRRSRVSARWLGRLRRPCVEIDKTTNEY